MACNRVYIWLKLEIAPDRRDWYGWIGFDDLKWVSGLTPICVKPLTPISSKAIWIEPFIFSRPCRVVWPAWNITYNKAELSYQHEINVKTFWTFCFLNRSPNHNINLNAFIIVNMVILFLHAILEKIMKQNITMKWIPKDKLYYTNARGFKMILLPMVKN